MASENLGELVVKISTDLADLTKGLAEANSKVQTASINIGQSIGRIGLGVAAVSGVFVAALGAMVKSTVDYGDEIFEVSQRTGIATETLSKLKYVAEQTESSFEAITTGFRFLARNIFEASSSNKELAITFKALGVTLKDSAGNLKRTEDIFLDIADTFSKLEDGAQKTAIAMQIFGRGGSALIPVLNLGREGIQRLSLEAEKLGLVLTQENAVAIDKFSDDLKSLKAALGGITLQIGNAVIPSLTELVNYIKAGVIPIIENLNALLKNTGAKLSQGLFKEAFASVDPVLEDARIKLVQLQQQRDELTKAAATSGGRGTAGQLEAIDALVVQEERLNVLIQSRMELVRNGQTEAQLNEQNLQKTKETNVSTDLNTIQVRKTALEAEQIGLKNFAGQIQALGANIQNSFSTALSSLILQGGKAKEIFMALGQTLVQSIVDFISQQIIAVTIGRAIRAAETALLTLMGAQVANAWAPAAAFVSLASFGANAAPASAGISGTVALSKGLAVSGFAEGTDTVPSMLSPGEMIVPRTFADAIRTGDLTLGGRNENNSFNNSSTNVNITVNAVIEHPIDIQTLAAELAFQTQKELRYVR